MRLLVDYFVMVPYGTYITSHILMDNTEFAPRLRIHKNLTIQNIIIMLIIINAIYIALLRKKNNYCFFFVFFYVIGSLNKDDGYGNENVSPKCNLTLS